MTAYGADYKTEVASRRATIAFLQEAGMSLRLYPIMNKACDFACFMNAL